MKKIIILITLSLLALSASYGNDPVQLFVNDLAQTRGANRWFVEDNSVPSPKGGYIYRFELDVDGDGQKEMFVSSSLDADKKGESWSVYRKKANGDYVKIKDSYLMGSALMAKVKDGIKKYSFYIPLRQQDGGSYFGYFWLDTSGSWQDQTHDFTDSEQSMVEGSDSSVLGTNGLPDWSKIAQKLDLGTPVAITIQKVLLAKFTQNASTAWRNVNTNFTLSQQYLDPADATDISSVANWQPPSSP